MKCNYMTYEHGPLKDCGKTATHQAVKRSSDDRRRCYCAEHNAQVSKRGGIETKPLNAERGVRNREQGTRKAECGTGND